MTLELELGHSASTLIDILLHRERAQPDQRAYNFIRNGENDVESLHYAALAQKARGIALSLQRMAGTGERALLLYPPGLDYIQAFFGAMLGGLIPVPIYPPLPGQSLSRVLSVAADSGATVVLSLSPIRQLVEDGLAGASDLLMKLKWLSTDDVPASSSSGIGVARPSRESLAFLQYTSGSTSEPKGVMLTHGNLLHNLEQIRVLCDHSASSHVVSWLPPYHDMGLIGGILEPLYVGFPSTLFSPLHFLQQPMRWLRIMSDYHATISVAPNFAYDLCVRKASGQDLSSLDLSAWRVAYNGAEPIQKKTLENFFITFARCGFRMETFFPCYGLAEATLIASGGPLDRFPAIQFADKQSLSLRKLSFTNREDPRAQPLVGCGKAIPGQEILIVDSEPAKPCAAKEIGEIWISGPSVALGYWNKPDLTETVFHARLSEQPPQMQQLGPGGYLRTGDLGFLEDGELYVVGRIKDLIIVEGRNHYPQDIERAVESCHAAIRPGCCAAFSIEEEGEERLVVVAEANLIDLVGLEEILGAVRQTVAQEHRLSAHRIVLIKPRTIPKTSSGKLMRFLCRSKFLCGELDVW